MNLYKKLIDKLFAVNLHGGMKFGLKNMEQLDALLDFPSRKFKSIHVAGTNGKGSVTTKIAHALEAEGYKVGLFTSPHISTFRERIQINKHLIDENTCAHLLQKIFDLIDAKSIPATFFEITTILAFIYFAEQQVDFVVLETGLGGRLDATNIVTPILSIITSISLEHTEYLGTTLEEITTEKAGIIKPHIPCLIGPHVPSDIIKKIASSYNSPLTILSQSFTNFDQENSAIAKRALRLLNISESSIQIGIQSRPPCRIEQVCATPPIILDVGHNPDGLEHLFQTLQQLYPHIPLRIIFGLSKTKDIDGCLSILKKNGSHFHLVEAPNGRGLPIPDLYKKMLAHNFPPQSISIDKTISLTIQKAIPLTTQHNELLLICGTFFIMSETRSALHIAEPRDDYDINER